MKVTSLSVVLLAVTVGTVSPFVVPTKSDHHSVVVVRGYLDDLSQYVYDPNAGKDVVDDSREATMLDKDKVDRYGPGDLRQFVDFNEFDGGDGQMGVAGDGSKGLDKEWQGQAEMAKSKTMSAKVAWGKSTGYADTLIESGVEATRAQQIENWKNQREVQEQRNQHRWMTDEFDNTSNKVDEDWRKLSSFSGQQVQAVDIDSVLGPVVPGQIAGTIQLQSRINQASVFEFELKNPFMGFSDFRARFTQMTNPAEWDITPTSGSLNGRGAPTTFTVKYRAQSPGQSQGYLVIQTEDDKWTYELMGFGSM